MSAPVKPVDDSVAPNERLVTVFSALSDATRLDMMAMLIRRDEVGCSEFDERFPLSKSTLSYHTKILNAAGLIETRRQGRFFFYKVRRDALDDALPGLADQLSRAGA